MSRRIEYLDSLRGLAATQVLIHHCFTIFPILYVVNQHKAITNGLVWALTYTPLHLMWDGPQAVIFFFVLSGFVLALPFFSENRPFYYSYLTRRFFRIYVPYIFVVSLSSVLLLWSLSSHPISGLSGDYIPMWSHPVHFKEYMKLILMVGEPNNVDAPAWSLAYEMRISIIFPFICLIVRKSNGGTVLGMCLILVLVSLFVKNHFNGVFESHFAIFHEMFETLFYLLFFIFGCMLAKYQRGIKKVFEKFENWKKLILLLMALGFYNLEWELPGIRNLAFGVKNSPYILEMAAGISSAVIIAGALSFERVQKILNFKIFLWLGKVSYSLYLTHVVVLLSSVYFLPQFIPLVMRVVLGACFSFMVAGLSYRYLEVPSNSAGHSLAKKIDEKIRLKHEKVL